MDLIAYHFTGDRLRDGQLIPPIGHTLVYDGEIELCMRGYHWSRTPWQALQYAPGPILHRVRIGGTVIEEPGDDKGVSSERTILASVDLKEMMLRFAADQALSVAHLWDMPVVVREYLETLDESKRARAREAAWAVAWDASWAPAREAAWAAVAAGSTAGARAAAWIAARDTSGEEEFNRRARAALGE